MYETEPWGVAPDSQPSYFNAVVVVKTTLPPSSLLERAHAVEEAFHRVRDEHWGPRTLDVDIVAYAEVVSDDPQLTLPHPRAHERAFVLAPGSTWTPRPGCPERAPSPTFWTPSPATASRPAPTWNSGCPSSR